MLAYLTERTRYLVFVGSILLVIIATQLIIQYDLNQQNFDARLINQAGRQRMLSQRISKLILFLHYNSGRVIKAEPYSLDSLKKLANEWSTHHYELLKLNEEVVQSSTIDSLMNLNTVWVEQIVGVTQKVVENPDQATLQSAIDTLAKTELPFLFTMERAVNEYQYEAEEKLTLLKRVEIILSLIAVIILVAEFVYIILPMLRSLQMNNNRLTQMNEELAVSEEHGRSQFNQINSLKLDLEEKHQQYKDFVDAASDMIYELDATGNFSFVNPVLLQKTGFTKEKLMGIEYRQMIHVEDVSRVVTFYEEQWAKREEESYLEFRITTRSKADLWVGQNVRMFFNGDNLLKVSAVCRDITSIKATELALQEERILLRTIIDNIPINIYAKDMLSRKILANKAELEYMGASTENEILGKTDTELFPEHSAATSRQEDLQVLRGHSILNKETANTRLDGTVTWFLVSKVPLRNIQGMITGIVGISIDITKQRQAQVELSRSEKLYRLVSENSQDVISIHHVDGVFEYVSPSSITLHGYTPEEMVGKNGLLFIHPDDGERIDSMAETTIALMKNNDPIPPMQFRLASRHNGFIWVENLIKPIFENGELIGFQSAVRNISAQKEYERALQEAKVKAEEATVAKSQFLSMMSHEIRTPLNGILGLTNILLTENPAKGQLENLNLLKFSGDNLLTIINDILDFSKVESGKMVLENIQFNLKELAQRTVKLLQERADRNGIELRLTLDSSLPHFVLGDPVRLGQVFNNLLSNAIKFTERGHVEMAITSKEKKGDAHVIHVSVTDSGIGISADKVKTIFERFSQASTDTTRKYGGTGLGLSITKKILELMESEITLVSTIGKGSEFSFELSLHESNEPISHVALPVEQEKLSGRILLAEDNDVNQAVARKFLGRWGFHVTIVENGEDAVKEVTSRTFDLILMDLHMPKMGGYEATRKIRSMDTAYSHELPIVALTADVSPEIKNAIKSAGMNDVLSKPFKPDELYSLLRKHLPQVGSAESSPEILSKLNPYTSGDTILERELATLMSGNLAELKVAVMESLTQQDIHLFEASLHKNKTALKILEDPIVNALTKQIKDEFNDKSSDKAHMIVQFSSQCDRLIRALRQVGSVI